MGIGYDLMRRLSAILARARRHGQRRPVAPRATTSPAIAPAATPMNAAPWAPAEAPWRRGGIEAVSSCDGTPLSIPRSHWSRDGLGTSCLGTTGTVSGSVSSRLLGTVGRSGNCGSVSHSTLAPSRNHSHSLATAASAAPRCPAIAAAPPAALRSESSRFAKWSCSAPRQFVRLAGGSGGSESSQHSRRTAHSSYHASAVAASSAVAACSAVAASSAPSLRPTLALTGETAQTFGWGGGMGEGRGG